MVALIFTACFVWGAIEYKIGPFYFVRRHRVGNGRRYVPCGRERSPGPCGVLVAIGIPMTFSGALQNAAFSCGRTRSSRITMTELDRVIHEPARLLIVTVLATVIEG